jgi:predicted transcriptional regulator
MFERVRDIMTTGVVTFPHDANVQDVFHHMEQRRFSQIPITDDDGQVVGLISEASVFAFMKGRGKNIGALMEPIPPKVAPTDFVDESLARSLEADDVLLVYEESQLLGVVTNSNLNKLVDDLEPYRIFPKLEQNLRVIVRYLLEQRRT